MAGVGLAVCDFGGGPRLARYDLEQDRVTDLGEPVAKLAERVAAFARDGVPLPPPGAVTREASEVRVLPPIAPDARIFCVAQNYADHAKEVNGTTGPPVPVFFLKPASSFVGSGESIEIPPVTRFLDYEAEIAVVIGQSVRRATPEDAALAIAGFTLSNDGTARDLQPIEIGDRQIIDWFSAKSLDRSSSLGPALVPSAAISAPDRIEFKLSIDGRQLQGDVTGSMRLSPSELVAFISHRVELLPGDIVLTGTPAGVGKARGRAMEAGDLVHVSGEGLGVLRNQVVSS